ncbi:MAG: hypothetical protein K0S32_2817 [Bacteroidetes bacterium]|jgi:hypothetical protein|nr:hypothetical protein [Bacteroidota bacterium]
MERYKIIEERKDPSREEIVAGMNFAAITSGMVILPKRSFPKSFLIAGLGIVAIATSLFIYKQSNIPSPIEKPKKEKVKCAISDTNSQYIKNVNKTVGAATSGTTIIKLAPGTRTVSDLVKSIDSIFSETPSVIVAEEATVLLPFKKLINADSKYAIELPMTVYGPVNVSQGYGDVSEYKEKITKLYEETNSAWFKFTIPKDTMLTFHIVPQLQTDDFDFILYKCTGEGCLKEFMPKKLLPVKKCLSWNTSHNCNTGLSQTAKDTLYEAVFANGEKQGQTYASGLKVKAGETYYLMVNTNMNNHQEPSGFMIYFFNHLPKKKANTYKK